MQVPVCLSVSVYMCMWKIFINFEEYKEISSRYTLISYCIILLWYTFYAPVSLIISEVPSVKLETQQLFTPECLHRWSSYLSFTCGHFQWEQTALLHGFCLYALYLCVYQKVSSASIPPTLNHLSHLSGLGLDNQGNVWYSS